MNQPPQLHSLQRWGYQIQACITGPNRARTSQSWPEWWDVSSLQFLMANKGSFLWTWSLSLGSTHILRPVCRFISNDWREQLDFFFKQAILTLLSPGWQTLETHTCLNPFTNLLPASRWTQNRQEKQSTTPNSLIYKREFREPHWPFDLSWVPTRVSSATTWPMTPIFSPPSYQVLMSVLAGLIHDLCRLLVVTIHPL